MCTAEDHLLSLGSITPNLIITSNSCFAVTNLSGASLRGRAKMVMRYIYKWNYISLPAIQYGCHTTCMEISKIAAERCGVLIYVNINEPRHRMMRTCAHLSIWRDTCGPAGRNVANTRGRYRHLVAANLPLHSITYFCFHCNETLNKCNEFDLLS